MIYQNPEDRNRDLPQYTTFLVGMYIFHHISIFLDVPKKHDITMTFPTKKSWRNQPPAAWTGSPASDGSVSSSLWTTVTIKTMMKVMAYTLWSWVIMLGVVSMEHVENVERCWKMLKDVEKEAGRVYLLGWWVLMMLAVHPVCHFCQGFLRLLFDVII